MRIILSLSDNLGKQTAIFGEEKPAPETPKGEPVVFGAKTVSMGREFTDPQPDLGKEHKDGPLWAQLLATAYAKSPILCGSLHGFRCMGTKIQKGTSGGYVIRPVLGPMTWTSAREYERDRERYLRPYAAEIAALLGELIEWESTNGNKG